MANNKEGFKKLLTARNNHLSGGTSTSEFLREVETILFNYVSVNNCKLSGGNYLYCYSTIAIRLLEDPENLKIDITY